METLPHSVSGRGVATITFNRPDRANSYDSAMLDTLSEAFGQYGTDPKVRVIVLRGAGKHFSAGAAIGEGGAKPRLSMGEVCALIDAVPKPTLAAVQGACIGGALAIASCCDMIIAGREASFSIPEVRLGFAPEPLIATFVRAMGYRAARRYLLSGRAFFRRRGVAHRPRRQGLRNRGTRPRMRRVDRPVPARRAGRDRAGQADASAQCGSAHDQRGADPGVSGGV